MPRLTGGDATALNFFVYPSEQFRILLDEVFHES